MKPDKPLLLEACVNSFIEAKKAQDKGANRIELCDNLAEGGTTPSYGTIEMCMKKLSIPVSVMIRPNGSANFRYTPEEVDIMLTDIDICKALKADGVVFGVLDDKYDIDVDIVKKLVERTKPLKVTFHMAFDQVKGDKRLVLESLIELGIDRVLTKGFEKNAIEGKENIRKLVEWAKERIAIIAGGGVTSENYRELAEYTGVKEVHGTKIVGPLTPT
eukprot:TRINITY_DN5328_c0_g4_i2.p1 TRINITY_DN5328_c0_g4~~TRINITY_DN5328_c0_g4_i2.p1  ORF type:complete len:217 (-),score=35.30 TRINITY_DN5328_c0_g4_i2:150-800(-)